MRKTTMITAALILLGLLSVPSVSSAAPCRSLSGTFGKKTVLSYRRKVETTIPAEKNPLLKTEDEIRAFNTLCLSDAKTGMTDLSTATELSAKEIRSKIEQYSFPNYSYLDGKKMTTTEKKTIQNNRNLDNVANGFYYGILTENGNIRSFPTDKALTKEKKDNIDRLQETKLYLGEGVLVLHTSTDGEWYFVLSTAYTGWVRKTSVAVCDREQFLSWIAPEKVAVVCKTGQRLSVEGQPVRLGTWLPLDGEGFVKVPLRNPDGTLGETHADITSSTAFCLGFLPLTEENLVSIASQFLGTEYSWGDKSVYGTDCSSTVLSVYRCFGLLLPRNTGTQKKMPCRTVPLTGNYQQKAEVLRTLPVGTLLYQGHHVMMYLGEKDGTLYVLHNTTTETGKNGKSIPVNSCSIMALDTGVKGNTMLDRVTTAKVLY